MLCKHCGAQLPDGTEKCKFCGAELAEEQETENVEETASEVPEDEEVLDENEINRRAQMEKMMAEKQQQLSEIEQRRNIKKKRQKQAKIAIICAICAGCVAIVGAGSYAIKQSINKPKATPSPTLTPISTLPVVAPSPLTTTPGPLSSMTPKAAINSSTTSSSSEVRSVSGASSGTAGGSSASSGSGASGAASSGSGTSGTSGAASSGTGSSSGGSSSKGGSASGSASAVSTAKASGISTSNVDAQLTTGGEVIYNNDTGRYLMTFASGGTLYYANVSEGSTTEQIKDKNITITAHPTAEQYKGNTVYEITSMTYYDDKDYIIPTSGTKLLTKDDIKNMSKEQLALARNEIYARHGRKFKMEEFRSYFSQKSWYKENPNYNYENEGSNLNEIESKNVVLILSVENSK